MEKFDVTNLWKGFGRLPATFAKLKNIMGDEKSTIFSFGCGVALDYLGAVEHFGKALTYYPIDECKWAICDTDNYKNFEPKLPKRIMNLDEGLFMLEITKRNPVLCFFNSIFSITQNIERIKTVF
jgi:hypothetical protein